jgi:hypothetical protein
MIWTTAASGQTIECKSIVNPLDRLHCYDTSTPPTKSLPDAFSRLVISILDTPAAAAAIVAAVLALISGIAGPVVQLRIGRRQAEVGQQAAAASQTAADASMLTARNVGNREIARLRISWIDKVRDVLSEYHAMLMSEEGFTGDAHQKLLQLGTQLDLLLNQDEIRQKALWDIADKIFRTDNLEARRAMDKDLIKAGRVVFDGEWTKIKAEMRGQ